MLQDLRFALRLIAKERWFSAAAIVALALGIGVNATGFTLVNGVFLRERSLRDANQVYVLSWRTTAARRAPLSYPDLEDWRAQSRSFAHLAAVTSDTLNISDDAGLPEQVYGTRVSAGAFAVFGQQPLVGRAFTDGDMRRGAPPVAIVAHHIWQNRYRGDAAVLGATLRVNGAPATIVGVMAPGTRFPNNAEVWMPFVPTAAHENRSNRQLNVFGRLAPAVSRREAQAEGDAIARRLISAYPGETKDLAGAFVESVPERFVGGPARTMFLALAAAVSFVLLIACANVANLLLSRSASRAREVAMRMAVGATRMRIVRQLLVESVILGAAGGALGLLIAYGGVRLFDAAVLDRTRPYWIVVYVPSAHEPPGGAWVLVRTGLPPGSVFSDVRRAVQAIDRDQPVFTVQTIEELLQERRWPYTAFGGAFAVFAVIALVLSSLGLYALVAYSVTERTQEIGVRMALGARGRHVSWMFLRRATIQLAIGLTLGLAGAFGVSRVLRSMLVRVTPGDPLTFVLVSGILAAVAIAACLLPVQRATRIDPLVALRQE